MPFSDLYTAVQGHQGRISTNWIRSKCIEFSDIKSVKEIWSSVVDEMNLRGFYIEGPLKGAVPLVEKESLIVLSRNMCSEKTEGDHWRRFVLTKELMHVFDEEQEKAQNAAQFDLQIEKLIDPAVQNSPQYIAEIKAQWRAIAVLCQEVRRQEFKKQLAANEISFTVVAAALQIPVNQVRTMMRDVFDEVLPHIM